MDLLEYIKSNKVTLLDGAMGTELKKRDVMGNFKNNLENKEIVKEIHQSYIKAGSSAIITNTFSMNSLYLESKGVDLNLELVNKKGVEIAKKAAGEDIFVLGDISSTGKLLKPYGTHEETEFIEVYKEKAKILDESGVDAFIIETMVDLREAVCALKACKEVSNLPVIVSISFDRVENVGRTVMGNTVKEVVGKLSEEKADVIGTNCGSLSPQQMSEIVKMMRGKTDLPIMVEPNAGQPKLKGEETVYDMPPTQFTAGILACIEAGANIVGGCCGTGPEHIEDINRALFK
ncbi:MAG TPA: homocysteine S-methyltransferase family protein [Halanaerobiales bacterium]|nr:homocysteine S-methyltransferase family protein [Halanaerobiales bacterium]